MSNSSVGKLINNDTKSELPFGLAPVEFHVDQSFELRAESCLGRALPIVSFHGGGAKVLSASLVFDRDAEENLDIAKVQKFLSSLGKVNAETKSIPTVTFSLGTFSFRGYPMRLGVNMGRFTKEGQATQLRVDLSLTAIEEDAHA